MTKGVIHICIHVCIQLASYMHITFNPHVNELYDFLDSLM